MPTSTGIQFNVNFTEDQLKANYAIPHGANKFSGVIGNDDSQTNELWPNIPVLYEVLADGREVASGHARGHVHDRLLYAEVAGRSTITLKVTNVGDEGGGTNVDWAEPAFH